MSKMRRVGRMNLNPRDIRPLHNVRTPGLRDELAADMMESGWQGRPLLVVESESGYQAWTGSHRIAAAIEAGMFEVPCYVISEKMIAKYGDGWGLVQDYERLNILRKTGDETAIRLMWLEGRE